MDKMLAALSDIIFLVRLALVRNGTGKRGV